MKYSMKDFSEAIETILRDLELKTATKFRGDQRVRVTRIGEGTLIVSYGKPNYSEREFKKKNPRGCWKFDVKKKRKR